MINPFYHFYRPPWPSYYRPFPYKKDLFQNVPQNKVDVNIQTEASLKQESHCDDNSIPEKALIEFYGIKLFSDDLLILSLIYFLYKENINDTLLYIALFALILF